MMKLCIAALLAVCVYAPNASALTVVNPDGSRAEPFQTWADRAAKNVRLPESRVVVMRVVDPCKGVGADGCLTDIGIEVSVDACVDMNPQGRCVGIFLHELGHVFDREQMTPFSRQQFLDAAGLLIPWESPTYAHRNGNEQFADAYVWAALFGANWKRFKRMSGSHGSGAGCRRTYCPTYTRFKLVGRLLAPPPLKSSVRSTR